MKLTFYGGFGTLQRMTKKAVPDSAQGEGENEDGVP